MPISSKKRPIKVKRKIDINSVNLEKIFDHFDGEIRKLYSELGSEGIIDRQNIFPGTGGSSPGPVVSSFTNFNQTEERVWSMMFGAGGADTPLDSSSSESNEYWRDPVIDILSTPPG